MPDAAVTGGAVAPAVVVPPAVPPAAAAPPVVSDLPPEALKARLEREASHARAETLKALGFATEDDAKAAAAELAKRREDAKTADTKAAEAAQRATVAEAEAAKHKATVTEMASRMMVGLSEEQTKAVKDLAGDDPGQQIRTIQTLQPLWAKAAAPAAPATAPAAKVAPASTSAAGNQPGDGANAPVNQRAVYEATRETNPFAAAIHGAKHPDVYVPKP